MLLKLYTRINIKIVRINIMTVSAELRAITILSFKILNFEFWVLGFKVWDFGFWILNFKF